jgi:hypothetical protein
MKNIIVVHEIDFENRKRSVVCVASSRFKALELMREYYGEGRHIIIDFKDIREDNIDFKCTVVVSGKHGGVYDIIAEDFKIDSI